MKKSRINKMFYKINKNNIKYIVKWHSKRIALYAQHVPNGQKKSTAREGSALCGVILRRSDVREGREEGQGCGSYGRDLESAGAAHDFPAAESPVSAVGPALPPAEGGAGPEIVRRTFLLPLLALFGWLCLGGGNASHEKK